MTDRLNRLRHIALAGVLLALPAGAQQPAPPAAPPAPAAQPAPAQPAAPAQPRAVLAADADAKVMVVGSVVQLRSGGPKMTVVELGAATVTTQWHQDNAGFKKETFPVAALKLTEADAADEDEDEDEDEDSE